MAVTKDYYAWLQTTARQNAATKKAALDIALQSMTTAQFDKSGKFIGYAKTATGAPKMGEFDVQHEQAKKNIEASGEAAGMLQSGQQAQNLSSEEANWRSRIAAATTDIGSQKNQVTTDLAQQLAQYQATYGKSNSSGGKKVVTPVTPPPGSGGPGPLGVIAPPPKFTPPKPSAWNPRSPRGFESKYG